MVFTYFKGVSTGRQAMGVGSQHLNMCLWQELGAGFLNCG